MCPSWQVKAAQAVETDALSMLEDMAQTGVPLSTNLPEKRNLVSSYEGGREMGRGKGEGVT